MSQNKCLAYQILLFHVEKYFFLSQLFLSHACVFMCLPLFLETHLVAAALMGGGIE